MTQRILPNNVSGGMCCYSQFAGTPYLHPSSKPFKCLYINKITQLKYAITLILINKLGGNKFILWQ